MTITTQTFLSNVAYGEPSDNYDGSSLDWSSDALTAANYYQGRGGLQTVIIRVTGFRGKLHVEATLDSVPDTATWFETSEYGDLVVPLTDYHPVSITGNFTWMRIRVTDFDAGVIDSVSLSY